MAGALPEGKRQKADAVQLDSVLKLDILEDRMVELEWPHKYGSSGAYWGSKSCLLAFDWKLG